MVRAAVRYLVRALCGAYAVNIGTLLAGSPGSVAMQVVCPGAMPTDPNPYVAAMEHHAGVGTWGSPERCPFHNAERLYRNFEQCKGLVITTAGIATEYAEAQQRHVRQHGRESPLFTHQAAKDKLHEAYPHGSYAGNRAEDAIDRAYAGQSNEEIRQALFCQCLLDSHDRSFGGTHEVDLVPRSLC